MARIEKSKQYILDERKLIIFERLAKGFSESDVARMVNVDQSIISRTFTENKKEYEEFVKKSI